MNLIYEFSDLSSAATLSGRFCLTLLHSIWIIALITLIAWCVSRILQHRFVEQSYYVCVLGLFASIATLPVTYAVLEVSADAIQSAEVIPVAVVTPAPLMAVKHETTDVKPALTAAAGIEAQAIVIHETNEVKNASTSEAMSFLWQDIFPWILFAYLIGVVLMIVRLARSTYQANQLASAFTLVTVGPLFETLQSVSAKLSNKIVPALALVEQTAMPKVIGVLRPMILLPTSVLTGLSQDELEMILMHELAHIRRHDMWINLVQRMAEAVLFFNPALWLLSRRISTLREYCCDEIACKASGSQENKVTNKESRTRYASALLHIVELTHGHLKSSELVSLSIAGRSPSELRRRIARLFNEPLREPLRITRGGVLALIATLAILLASPLAWQTQAQNSPSTESDKNEAALVKEQFPELAQIKTGISKEKWRTILGDSIYLQLFRVESKTGRKTFKYEIKETTFFATFANDKLVDLVRIKTSEYQNPLAPPAGLSPRETVNQFIDRMAEGKKTIHGIRGSWEHAWAYTTRENGMDLSTRLAGRPAFRAVAHLGKDGQAVVLTGTERESVSSVQPRVGVYELIKQYGQWRIQKMDLYKPDNAWSFAEGFSRNKDVHWGILRTDIIGSFNYFDINYHFKADGSYRQTERDKKTATGTWQLKGDRLIRVIDGKEHSIRILRPFEEGFIVEYKKGYQAGWYRIKPKNEGNSKATKRSPVIIDKSKEEEPNENDHSSTAHNLLRFVKIPKLPRSPAPGGGLAGFGTFELRDLDEDMSQVGSVGWESTVPTNGLLTIPDGKALRLTIDSYNSTDLSALQNFGENDLQWLSLPTQNKINDHALPNIAKMTGLVRLYLSGSSITDEGVAHLGALQNLEYLSLQGCSITDAAIESLAELTSLKELNIRNTEITSDGITRILHVLPDCRITST